MRALLLPEAAGADGGGAEQEAAEGGGGGLDGVSQRTRDLAQRLLAQLQQHLQGQGQQARLEM